MVTGFSSEVAESIVSNEDPFPPQAARVRVTVNSEKILGIRFMVNSFNFCCVSSFEREMTGEVLQRSSGLQLIIAIFEPKIKLL